MLFIIVQQILHVLFSPTKCCFHGPVIPPLPGVLRIKKMAPEYGHMQLLHMFVIFQKFGNFANFHVFHDFSTDCACPTHSQQLLFTRPGDPPSDRLWVVNQTFTKLDLVYSDFV